MLPSHPEFMAGFDLALRGGALPIGVTARDPSEVARRFDVYRNNVAVSLSEALARRFPVIRRLVGEDFFVAMARVYAEAERPKSPVLAEWGGGFAAFLEQFPPLANFPYMGDVARIEFARGCAFHAADARPVDAAVFATSCPEDLRLRLHPSVTLLHLRYPAVSIWARNQNGAKGATAATGPETALILRDRTYQVPVRALGGGDGAMVTALLAGERLADAALSARKAQANHDPMPLLVALMQAGAITDLTE